MVAITACIHTLLAMVDALAKHGAPRRFSGGR
jgi:hypothetical protein